uniref:Dipeptidyl peptidase n=1 Tax=Globodera pallida TaxID=36090 RepID=A0A183C9C1_GLOPA
MGLKDAEMQSSSGLIGDAGVEEELSGTSPQERNWRGIATALLVIVAMCSLIALAVLVLTPPLLDADQPQSRISLADVLTHRFLSPVESLEWLDSRRLLVKLAETVKVLELDEKSEDGGPIGWAWKTLPGDLFRFGKPSAVSLSPGGRFILFNYAPSKRSPKSTYRIFDTEKQIFENVGPKRSGDENVRVFVWSPSGDDFAYVHENEVYFQQSPSAKQSVQLTNDSSADLLNGVADWLYEEEILQSAQTLWWSTDGQYLAFLTIDNREVPHVPINYYAEHQYPFMMQQPYPKTGEPKLPEVWLNMWRKNDSTLRRIRVDAIDKSARAYLFSTTWLQLHGQQVLAAVWANRFQNQITVSMCTFDAAQCVPTLGLPLRLWAEPEDSALVDAPNNAFYTLLPHRRANGNVYTHLALVNVPAEFSGGRESFLAMSDFDVIKINGLDKKHRKIYYTAAAPSPAQRHLYVSPSVPTLDNGEEPICLSCNISSNCSFHDSSLADDGGASDGRFVYLSCKGPGAPYVLVARLNTAEDRIESVLEFGRNEALEKALHTHRFPSVHFEQLQLDNGAETYAKILVPYGVSLKEQRPERKYRVLVDVYAGPGTQKVTDEWASSHLLDFFFVSSLEFIVVFIDGRGSGHRGWHQKQPLYGNFGTVEVDDQIMTMRALLRKYPLMDEKRVAIWGWSYGGFVTARAVQRDMTVNRTFSCAASVAPVSNFKFYDATYVERYMGEAGPEAYERTDLSIDVQPFHNVSFMLAHGAADDNVHYQNSAEFIRALTDDNVQFRLMVYTDESHNLSGVRWHLYTMLTKFLQNCFSK